MDVYYRRLQSHPIASFPVKVIYLAGTTRCGSTFVGSLLGKVPGFVHVGEIARIWQEGFVENHRCGCRTPFRECAFWTAVLERAFGGRDQVDIQPILGQRAADQRRLRGVDMHKDETPIPTSLRWLAFNGLAAALWDRPAGPARYIHLRYEDLASDPVGVLGLLLGWLGEPVDPHEIVGADHRFTRTPAHTIAGNPMRFERGVVKIRPDTAWQHEASARDKLLVSGLTWPLLVKYGYPLVR
jgi:hypothetical protein